MERIITSTLSISREERANALTHALGILFCLIGVPYLLIESSGIGGWEKVAGLAVFGFSMTLVYLSSTIYHAVSSERLKQLWHRIDHISIYFLIAGTHTPFLLFLADGGGGGTFYLYLLWGMVALGVLYKMFFFGRFKLLSVFYYLAMGWVAIFTIPSILQMMGDTVLFWIIAGGALYTLGVIFFLWEKLPYHHAIWHLFVLGGSAAHFMAMVYLVQAG